MKIRAVSVDLDKPVGQRLLQGVKEEVKTVATEALSDDENVSTAAAAAVFEKLNEAGVVVSSDPRLPNIGSLDIGMRWIVRSGKYVAIAINDDGSAFIARLDADTINYLSSILGTAPLPALGRSTIGDSFYPWRVRPDGSNETPLAVRHDGAVEFSKLTESALDYLSETLEISSAPISSSPNLPGDESWFPEIVSNALYATHQPTGRRVFVDSSPVSDVKTTQRDVVWTKGGVQYHRRHPDEPNYLAVTNKSKFSMWGSSTASGFKGSMITMLETLGIPSSGYFNGGAGGNRSPQILARLGVRPLRVNAVTLAASGATEVVSQNVATTGSVGALSYAGYFEGFESVTGALSVATSNPAAGTPLLFTRNSAGASVNIPDGTPFIPTKALEYRDCAAILNIAKNSLADDPSSWKVAYQDTVDCYEWMRSVTKHVAVMGHFVNSNAPANSPQHFGIQSYNAALADRFKDRYIDLSGYLTSPQVWVDSGLTPTETDLEQQERGVKPVSLSSDDLHQNTAGYTVATNYLIKPKLLSLGWF